MSDANFGFSKFSDNDFYSNVNNHYHKNSRTDQLLIAGYINATGAVDEITFKMSSGNFDGVIQMYGIK